MKKIVLALALAATTFSAEAKKNSVDIGVLWGVTGARTTNSVAITTEVSSEVPAVSFTADFNFDGGGRRFYLSVPVRLHTNYFHTSESYDYSVYPYPTQYPYGYPYYYNQSYSISAASLGTGLGFTYMPVTGKKADMCIGGAVVPSIEVGRFRGACRFQASGEVHVGVRFMNRIYLGARYTYYVEPYSADAPMPQVRNQYGISNIQGDLRFRIKK